MTLEIHISGEGFFDALIIACMIALPVLVGVIIGMMLP